MHLWYIWFVYPLYASLGSAPQLLLLRAACQSGLSEEQPAESFRGSFTQCRSMDGCSYLPSCFIMAYVCFWKSQAHKFWDDSSQVLLTFCGTKKCSQASSSSRPFLARFSLSDYPMTSLSFVIRPFKTHNFCFCSRIFFSFQQVDSAVAIMGCNSSTSKSQVASSAEHHFTITFNTIHAEAGKTLLNSTNLSKALGRTCELLYGQSFEIQIQLCRIVFFSRFVLVPAATWLCSRHLPQLSGQAWRDRHLVSYFSQSLHYLRSTPKHTSRKPLTSLKTAGLGPHLWQRLFRKRRWCSIHPTEAWPPSRCTRNCRVRQAIQEEEEEEEKSAR